MRIAINRTVAPEPSLDDFLALARGAGAVAVEVRNEVEGREFADGTPARDLAARIADAGLAVASINALQRFNDWTPEREREAVALAAYARDLGAPGLVLCPLVDAGHGWSVAEAAARLRAALRGLMPILAGHGVTGYVEPLGMRESTLRHQAAAVEALGDVDGFGDFALCYDTFQHWRARDPGLFAERIGLVHGSGITRGDRDREALTEPDRGLIDAADVTEALPRLRRLPAAGYAGFISVEPFDPCVQRDPELAAKLRASIERMTAAVAA